MTVRLPSGDWYALAVDKEQRWLPVIAPRLPLPVPAPVARGVPGLGYPYPWSVYRWLDGRTASPGGIHDLTAFATSLAGFLVALRGVDPTGGPEPGRHNFFRGGPLTTYVDETLRAIDALDAIGERGAGIARDDALWTWDEAVAATWRGRPTWFHGDVSVGNLLVRDGALAAVIDFGASGVGDPGCDVVIAWTLLSGPSREAFRRTLRVDTGTWARGRGWALWKALITLVGAGTAAEAAVPRHVIAEVLADRAAERP